MSINKIPVTVLDDFFETPDLVRNYALNLEYGKTGPYVPGIRSRFLHQIDDRFHHYLNKKLFSLFFDLSTHEFNCTVQSQFQLISGKYEEGWVHDDIDDSHWDFAGVVYLTPNAPLSGGTSIYRQRTDVDYDAVDYDAQNKLKSLFYNDKPVDVAEYRAVRDAHNSRYEETLAVNNVYNRLVVYPTDQLHRAREYFGSDKTDNRLTLVFFAKVQTLNWTESPVLRSKNFTMGN
jgi:hypothetical protein